METKLRKNLIFHRNLKNSSVKMYESTLNTIAETFSTRYITKDFIRKNIDNIIQHYKKEGSHSKQQGVLSVLLIVLSPKGTDKYLPEDKTLYEKIKKELWEHNKLYKKDKLEQKKTQKEKDNWIEYDVIRDWIRNNYKIIIKKAKGKLEVGTLNDLQELLVIMLYHFIPPRRLDYSTMIITTPNKYDKMDKRNVNAFVITRPQRDSFISFGADIAKSKKKEDCVIVKMGKDYDEFPNVVLKVLKQIIKQIYKNDDGNYRMLQNSNGGDMSKPSMTKFIKKTFNKHFEKDVSATLLRKIYLSNIKQELSLKKRLRIAEIMNHSVLTAMWHYTKID